jgi:proliferating cell nuclear antigen
MPLTLKLKMVSEDGELSFLLAPRIEDEDWFYLHILIF